MSAIEDYRSAHECWDSPTFWPPTSDGPTAIFIADAAVAELEAELASLKARRCETCKSYDVDTRFCAALTQHWHPDFWCAGWAEGITP